MPGLKQFPSLDLPLLPAAQVTLRKIDRGFASTLSPTSWENRVGRVIQSGIVSIGLLLLLALPLSLGFVVGHTGSRVSQPMAISSAFVGGTMAGEVLPTILTTSPLDGGGRSTAGISGVLLQDG